MTAAAARVSWSRCGGADCLRVAALAPGACLEVRAGTATPGLPAMAGTLVPDGTGVCFIPRYAFLDGTAYTVTVDGVVAATLVRARPDGLPTTEVAGNSVSRVFDRDLTRSEDQPRLAEPVTLTFCPPNALTMDGQ